MGYFLGGCFEGQGELFCSVIFRGQGGLVGGLKNGLKNHHQNGCFWGLKMA